MSRFHTRNPKIFGSVSRGEDTEASDLDISIEVDQGISYYDLAQIEIELEAILGCKVDVVTRGCLAPDVAEHGMSREQFLDDEKTQDAASKCAEAIGEAANQLMALDPTYDSRHPELQLKNAYKSRNRLSHGYYSVDIYSFMANCFAVDTIDRRCSPQCACRT